MADPAYRGEYLRERQLLAAVPTLCQLRIAGVCTGRATSLDHQPPLALHHHVEGSSCCLRIPACLACKLKAGRWNVANAKRGRGLKRHPAAAPAPSRSW